MPYKDINEKREYSKQYYKKNKGKLIEYAEQWQKNNSEKRKEIVKKYYLNHLEKNKEYREQYYQDNREKILERQKKHNQNCKERIKEYHKLYNQINKEEIKKQKRQYFQMHKLEINNRRRGYYKYKGKTDLRYSLGHKTSNRIRESLKNNKTGRHWEDLVGYTLDDLIKHLKSTIPKGYTWQDYLDGKLQIDHIIPIAVFNFTQPEHLDFKRCWTLDNLRLLHARENIKKKNKLERPFQPALAI